MTALTMEAQFRPMLEPPAEALEEPSNINNVLTLQPLQDVSLMNE